MNIFFKGSRRAASDWHAMSGSRKLHFADFRPVIAVFAALLLFLFFLPVKTFFIAENQENSQVEYLSGFSPGMEFSISYIHSVNRSRITDNFHIEKNGEVYLSSSLFSSFGAGVATEPEEGSFFLYENDSINYAGIDRKIDDLVVFVGTEAEHVLVLSDKEVLLKTVAPPQTGLRIRAGRLSAAELAFYYIRKGVLHGKS